ncbi:hypothetical protein BC829DRAFT_394523 [Chytridium lagenaria]|nr:hypothetical protein BC829DRAFT_394523 [Chytridium lagenaria]
MTQKIDDFVGLEIGFYGSALLQRIPLCQVSHATASSKKDAWEISSTSYAPKVLVSINEMIWDAAKQSAPHSHIPVFTSSTTLGSRRGRTLSEGRHDFPFVLHVPSSLSLIPDGQGSSRSLSASSLTPATPQPVRLTRTKIVYLSRRRLLLESPSVGLKQKTAFNNFEDGPEDDANMSFEDFLASGPSQATSETSSMSTPTEPDLPMQRGLLLCRPPSASKTSLPPIAGSSATGLRLVNGTSKYVLFEYKLTVPKEICIDSSLFRLTLNIQTAPGASIGYLDSVSAVLEERIAYSLRMTHTPNHVSETVSAVSDEPRRRSIENTTGSIHSIQSESTRTRKAASPARPHTPPLPFNNAQRLRIATSNPSLHSNTDSNYSPATHLALVSSTEEFLHDQSLSEPVVYPISFPSRGDGFVDTAVPSDQPFVLSFALPVIKEKASPDVAGCPEIRISHILKFKIAYVRVGDRWDAIRIEEVEVPVSVVDGCLRLR